MSKTSGLGAQVMVDNTSGSAKDISTDVTEFSISTPVALQDITGVGKSAHERLSVLADGSVSLKGVFDNGSSSLAHQVLSGVTSQTSTRTVQIAPTATSGGAPYLAMEMLFSGYDVSRSATGELTWSSAASLADGTSPSWTNS